MHNLVSHVTLLSLRGQIVGAGVPKMLLDKLGRIAIGRMFFNSWASHRSVCSVYLREVDREGIKINWGDDKQNSYYHSVWLRHNCQCPLCTAADSGQRTVESYELVNSRIAKVDIEGVVYSREDLVHL